MNAAAKRIALETLGWIVLVAGILMLLLPGPGLLGTFAGLWILSTQYAWARRWTNPVKFRALRGAAEGVETIPRIVLSALIALGLVGVAVVWLIGPPPPGWWPVDERWWLFGGPPVAITMIVSSAIAIGLLIYSVVRFYGKPEALAEVDRMEAEHKKAIAREQRREAREEHHEAREATLEAAEADRVADASEEAAGRRGPSA
ncbi:PGPGW domain-containing protein [Serinicoccus chungangensis]|uniref:PGPGW domain-containing protein n=1 Tax=Serinicoccus chungangensis TaxID=767452 RepID=UPI001EE815CF|nr:PGPGW domain-containing protein [Serinicoccus chungangensis]